MLTTNLTLANTKKLARTNLRTRTYRMLILVIVIQLLASEQLIPSPIVFAQTSSNQNFMLEIDGIDTNPQPTTAPLVPPAAPLPIPTITQFTTGPNYTVTVHDSALSFQISQNTVDFGILSGNNPIVRTTDISFSPPGVGARILAHQNQPMSNSEKLIIPDTTCDNGLCTEKQSAEWSSTFTYGFGYRCESSHNICNPTFARSNHFKQYPDISRSEAPEVVLENVRSSDTLTAKLFYKLNISGTQKPGTYTNTVTYIAIPNF